MNIPIKVNIKKPYQLGTVGTPSSGGCTSGEIPDNSISTAKIKDKSVTPEKLDREYLEFSIFEGFYLEDFFDLDNRVLFVESDIQDINEKLQNNVISLTPQNEEVNISILKKGEFYKIDSPVKKLSIWSMTGNVSQTLDHTASVVFSTSTNNDFDLVLPEKVKWAFDSAPMFERGKTYCIEFTPVDFLAFGYFIATCVEVTI